MPAVRLLPLLIPFACITAHVMAQGGNPRGGIAPPRQDSAPSRVVRYELTVSSETMELRGSTPVPVTTSTHVVCAFTAHDAKDASAALRTCKIEDAAVTIAAPEGTLTSGRELRGRILTVIMRENGRIDWTGSAYDSLTRDQAELLARVSGAFPQIDPAQRDSARLTTGTTWTQHRTDRFGRPDDSIVVARSDTFVVAGTRRAEDRDCADISWHGTLTSPERPLTGNDGARAALSMHREGSILLDRRDGSLLRHSWTGTGERTVLIAAKRRQLLLGYTETGTLRALP